MRPSVLVIEDHGPSRDLMCQILEEDFDVEARGDGAAGLAAVFALRPDVVVLDLSMPIMDGWEVASRIRADPTVSRTRIIALTAHAMPGDRQAALDAGCDEYLTKPVDEDELIRVLNDLLAHDNA